MTSPMAWAVFLGSVLGLGLWSLVSVTPRFGRPRLAARVAPSLLDVSVEARKVVGRTTVSPIPVLGSIFAPLIQRMVRPFGALVGGADATERRLRQSGSRQSVDAFRALQLVWALVGIALASAAVLLLPAFQALPLLARLLLPLVGGVSAAFGRDLLLQRAAAHRVARIRSELPTVLEFLTLSLSAGEGILDGLRRVSKAGSGDVSKELFGVVAEVHAGVPLATALTSLTQRLQISALSRFVDQLIGALERGTPLADVLRAQAQDAREEAKRDLLESAGRKEVSMMVPIESPIGCF
ncbi:type II secretion system F family protein [Glaciibacter psychrotolerans]|uniref:Tight adherence protein C n=1 Tax=Glaciibacter psychrotolerans TaxID=670054 RepID=A0A7Z0J5Y5_9MICO|nr:tight adherence protein C [Leifsonia psychrotolerans]